MCAYLLAQAFTIPLVAIGPWPVWPTLADLAFGFLLLAWLMSPKSAERSTTRSRAPLVVFGLVAFCAFSYVLFTVVGENLNSPGFGAKSGFQTGAFQLVRLIQFATLFWLVSQIPLTAFRLHVLLRSARWVLVIVSGLIIATYLGLIAQSAFVGHLPAGAVAVGPWQVLLTSIHDQGLGAVGYNHAYVSAQVTVLLALCLHLTPRDAIWSQVGLITLSTAAVTVTGSRAGFVAHLLFLLLYLAWRSWPTLIVLGVLGIALTVAPSAFSPELPRGSSDQTLTSEQQETLPILERQRTVFALGDGQSLSGRDSIWQEKVSALNDSPLHWVTGWGFGTSGDHGFGITAHMLPLQVTVEMGLVGLALFAMAVVGLLRGLWRAESAPKPIFLVTIALLASSFSQENFYPVAAMGHFIGLFLLVVAIGLSRTAGDAGRASRLRGGL
jgi:O-antigen ligase